MRRSCIRLTPNDEIVRRKWAVAVLGVLALIVTSTLTLPAFQKAGSERLASACGDDRAGEAVAQLIETARETNQRLALSRPAECRVRVEAR